MTVAPVNPASIVRARERSPLEYRAFLGMMMAASAISIDLILPAFGRIRHDLHLADTSSQTTRLISIFFLGLACGPIPFGLLSDRVGRRIVLWLSCVVMIVAALVCGLASSLALMVVCRFFWGVGASGLRVVATAMVRDRYSGDRMAREMAFVWTVFILVPVVAPLAGAGIIHVVAWRWTFVVCAAFAAALGAWSLRIAETLPVERRQRLHIAQIGIAAQAIMRSRKALGYSLALLPLFAVFSSYLGSSELIVGDVFHRAGQFPFIFGGTAVLMGLASHVAGHHVMRLGLDRVILLALSAYVVAAAALAVVGRGHGGHPSFWVWLPLLALVLAAHNVLFPNLNAAAMGPVGHVAGTAAAVIVTASTAFGALVGQRINDAFDGSVRTLSTAFAMAGAIALVLCLWAGRSRAVHR